MMLPSILALCDIPLSALQCFKPVPFSKLISSLLRVLVHPVLGLSVELGPLGPELVGDTSFDRIVRLGLGENRLDQLEDVCDLVRRLPLVAAEDAQTHGAFVVV